jgi:hypothetical protein
MHDEGVVARNPVHRPGTDIIRKFQTMQAINRKSGEVPVCKLSEGVV